WNAGPIAKIVLLVLMTFSIVSWALIVEKAWQFRRVRRQTFEFIRVFREARRPSIVHSTARKLRQSPLAQLYFAAYQEVSGIPEALIATAAGLGAASPAVIGYNYFVNRVKHWAVEMEGFTMDLLNLLSRPAAKAG